MNVHVHPVFILRFYNYENMRNVRLDYIDNSFYQSYNKYVSIQ